jgi:peptidyl-prolyl cis-trans isomerase C
MGDRVSQQPKENSEFGVRSSEWRRAGLLISAAVAAISVAGCDKLSELVSPKSSANGPAPAATAPTFPLRPEVPPSEVIANVNGKTISIRELEGAIQEIKAAREAVGAPWEKLSSEDLKNLAESFVLDELRTQDAIARGLDRNQEIQLKFLNRYRGFYSQEWVAWQLDRTTVTQNEVEQFYNDPRNQPFFREPEQVRLRQLIVSGEDQAKAALVQLLEGVDFVTVAQQTSIRPEAAQGAPAQQWVMRSIEKAAFAPGDDAVRDLRDPVLEQAAFAIDKTGGISSYVKGADGHYHIFQLVERKALRQRPLLEVQDSVKNFLQLQKLTEVTEQLRTKAKVEGPFVERLEGIKQ